MCVRVYQQYFNARKLFYISLTCSQIMVIFRLQVKLTPLVFNVT